MFSPDVPKSEPDSPPPSDTAAEEAMAAERKKLKNKKGTMATRLTKQPLLANPRGTGELGGGGQGAESLGTK